MATISQDMPRLRPGIAKTIIELTPAGYCVLDRDFRVRYANQHFCRLVDVAPAAALGARCYDLINHGRPCQACAARQVRENGLPRHMSVCKDTRPDGACHYLDKRVLPIFGEGGRVEYTLSLFLDRTEQVRLQKKSDAVFYDLVRSLVSILEKKDAYTSQHSAHVSAISARLAKFMGLADDEVYRVYLGALLHDIGKVLVPDSIINKPGGLTEGEYETVKRHPAESFDMLGRLSGGGFEAVRRVCRHHHERWDGTGYPDGLAGHEIPLGSQIIAVADAYDAMTSDRPYRRGMGHQAALKNIRDGLGTQFSPQAGARFLEMATLYFTGREQMTAKEVTAVDPFTRYLAEDGHDVTARCIGPKDPATPHWDEGSPSCMAWALGDDMARRLLDATPTYYAIFDRHMTLRYASASILRASRHRAEDLLGRKCYELDTQGGGCLMHGPGLLCAGQRALRQGTVEYAEWDGVWAGVPRAFDKCATPIEVDGETYILEALFDRSKEAAVRAGLARSCRAIIHILQALIARINPEETAGSEALIHECHAVGDYFARYDESGGLPG